MNSHVKLDKLRRAELLMRLHLRAVGCHLPYRITHCYCHPTEINTPHLNVRQRVVLDLPTPGRWKAYERSVDVHRGP